VGCGRWLGCYYAILRVTRMNKPWYKSKTIWFNGLTAAAMVISGVQGLLPMIEVELTPTVYNYLLFTMGVVNILLRSVTKHGVSVKD